MTTSDREDTAAGDNDEIYTVTEITEAIRQDLESEFPAVRIIGEIANFKHHTSGHFYLTLRDDKNLVRAVMFRRCAAGITFSPENGMMVIASGRISHYGGSGQTQLVAEKMEIAGRGDMELEFRRLLVRLSSEGLTDPGRKRPIPVYPSKVAVITSASGAVIRDITSTVRRRWPVAEILHIPADVQGPAAMQSIIGAFERLEGMAGIDVIILARGGGSVEDLWAFNLEGTARAVAGCRYPVITGIGHEIDTTICDHVSDLRAPTPTAAAELATPSIDEVDAYVFDLMKRLSRSWRDSSEKHLLLLEYLLRSSAFPALEHRLDNAAMQLDDRLDRLDSWWKLLFQKFKSSVSESLAGIRLESRRRHSASAGLLSTLTERIAFGNPALRISESRERLDSLIRIVAIRAASGIDIRRSAADGLSRALEELNPTGVLRRGYSFCTSEDGTRVIGDVAGVSVGDSMTVNFHDGSAVCEVEKKRKGQRWRAR